jgi:hypothetical protein
MRAARNGLYGKSVLMFLFGVFGGMCGESSCNVFLLLFMILWIHISAMLCRRVVLMLWYAFPFLGLRFILLFAWWPLLFLFFLNRRYIDNRYHPSPSLSKLSYKKKQWRPSLTKAMS